MSVCSRSGVILNRGDLPHRRVAFRSVLFTGAVLAAMACSNDDKNGAEGPAGGGTTQGETSDGTSTGGSSAGATNGGTSTVGQGAGDTSQGNDSTQGSGGDTNVTGDTGDETAVGTGDTSGDETTAAQSGDTSGDETNASGATSGDETTVSGSGDTSGDETTSGGDTCDASAAPAIKQLGLETVVQSDDFQVLVYAAQPPGSDDWYLVDALGYVRVYSEGVLQPTPFLDVSDEVRDSGFSTGTPEGGQQNYDERGLLGIAFPPDYATSGKFYVTLIPTTTEATDPDYDLEDHDLVLEYTRSADNPLVADPTSRKAIIDLERGGDGYTRGTAFSYAKYHNGSTVLFGPDGMLYVGMGDGGGDCNAARRGAPQDVDSPYGKILRLDPNQPAPYAAEGNPFVEGGDPRVLHYGLRNPFRFSFDSQTGDLYIGEVGQWTNDWVSYAPAGTQGLNFGWPTFEGTTENPTAQCDSGSVGIRAGATRTAPIFSLPHAGDGGAQNLIVAIVGGAVYRGNAIPELKGAYLFGEFYPNREMRALYQCGTETSEVTVIQKRCDPNLPDAACFLAPTGPGAPTALRQVAAVIEGHDGELYIPANGNALLKVVPAP